AVPRSRTRLQRAGDRLDEIFHRHISAAGYSRVHVLRKASRFALAAHDRPGLLRHWNMELYADHPRLGLARAARPAGTPRVRAAIRGGAHGDFDFGRSRTGALEAGLRPVQLDA